MRLAEPMPWSACASEPTTSSPPNEHERVLALVRRFGSAAISFQVLEPGYSYFFHGDEGCVAYVDTGKAWIAAGAPLADEAKMGAVAVAFVAAAHAANRRACFFGVEAHAVHRLPLRWLLIGEQPMWDPGEWEATLRRSGSLREQLRRARAKGVSIRLLGPEEAPTLRSATVAAMQSMKERWLSARELAPMHFLARVEPIMLLPDQRLYVAVRDGALVGSLSVAPICRRDGWLLQNLLRLPDAPNGTAEALIDRAMRDASDAQRAFVTLGLAPLAGNVRRPLRLARAAGRALYNFEGLRAFRAKLLPARWDPVFLSFTAETSAPRAIVDVLSAFARDGLWRFGLRTLARGPTILVRLLMALLVPWTAALAVANADRWFPSPAIKWAWVAFDVMLAIGLGSLCLRWRTGLARLLVIVIGCDAVATAIEAGWWNASHAKDLVAKMVVVAGVAAPALACLVLRQAVRRRATARR